MITSIQKAILDRLLANLAAGTTVDAGRTERRPASDYVDASRLAAEKARVFRDYPLVVGFSRDLEGPGAFKTLDIAGLEVILVRGGDGVARAFRNMCRHRGVKLMAQSCGRDKLFTCPFHAWSYSTEGRLVAVPKSQSFGEVDPEHRALISYPLVEAYGILWLKLSPGDPDIDAWLGPLAPEIAALRLGERARMGTKILDAAINWKLAIDTFGETYHFDSLHKTTIRAYFQSNIHDYETFGFNHRMVFAGNAIEDLRSQPEETWDYARNTLTAYFLFPNTQIITLPNHVDLFQILPDPIDATRSRTLYSYYPTPDFVAPEDAFSHEATFELTAFVIAQEDYAAAETAQANFAADPDANVLFGRNEPALHHYKQSLESALANGRRRALPENGVRVHDIQNA